MAAASQLTANVLRFLEAGEATRDYICQQTGFSKKQVDNALQYLKARRLVAYRRTGRAVTWFAVVFP